ncbi:hypothetical protein FRACA_1350012 [Frankia canadensis]|uniref:Uncharacterized protein n=1 Tax=Frankia canadensis TaxID=1836972 RepID=A0A2I2KKW8_9ACTN|nr:hypothetical protein FRACA_1350012 [Frankia canadensis]SOU53612.1 hypothetical protein FRACA_1350012 [Frankia canadensis]
MLGERQDAARGRVARLLDAGQEQQVEIGDAIVVGQRRLLGVLGELGGGEHRGHPGHGLGAPRREQSAAVLGDAEADRPRLVVDGAGAAVDQSGDRVGPAGQGGPVGARSAEQQRHRVGRVRPGDVRREVARAALEGRPHPPRGQPAQLGFQRGGGVPVERGLQQVPNERVARVVGHPDQDAGVHTDRQVVEMGTAAGAATAALGGEDGIGRGGGDVGVAGQHPEPLAVHGDPRRVEQDRRLRPQPGEDVVGDAVGETRGVRQVDAAEHGRQPGWGIDGGRRDGLAAWAGDRFGRAHVASPFGWGAEAGPAPARDWSCPGAPPAVTASGVLRPWDRGADSRAAAFVDRCPEVRRKAVSVLSFPHCQTDLTLGGGNPYRQPQHASGAPLSARISRVMVAALFQISNISRVADGNCDLHHK